MRKKNYRSFEDARKFVRTLGLKNEKDDWREYSRSGKRPDDIPSNPYNTYKKEWVSWPDFLGSDKTNPRSVPKKSEWSYEKAKTFLRKLEVKDKEDFYRLKKLGKIPKKIPSGARQVYINKGWEGWGDFLSTGTIAKQDRVYKTFEEARKFVRSLGLKTQDAWNEYTKSGNLPVDIPNVPRIVYKKEWKSMGDWIGTDYIANRYRIFWSYDKAKAFVIKQGITSSNEFKKAKIEKKLPDDIPSNPSLEYEKEWEGWGIFLGTGIIANRDKEFWSYNKARTFLKKLGIEKRDHFYQLSKEGKIPKEIPLNSNQFYKKEWKGWGDFLGTGTIATQDREYLPPIEAKIEARKYQKKLGIKTETQWIEAHRAGKIPANLPRYLANIYGDKRRRK